MQEAVEMYKLYIIHVLRGFCSEGNDSLANVLLEILVSLLTMIKPDKIWYHQGEIMASSCKTFVVLGKPGCQAMAMCGQK